jgi:5-formyltetrahydrofolate cyclo-ligase
MGIQPPASKEAERRRQKARRGALSEQYWQRVGAAITERVVDLISTHSPRSVGVYAALPDEPMLTALPFAGLYPRVSGDAMTFHRCAFERLEPGSFGVLEPPPDAAVEDPEVVLVPGQAFTDTGARLGRGAGYYDRFLIHSDALRIGVTDEAGLCSHLPTNTHDIPMDYVVTERRSLAISARI